MRSHTLARVREWVIANGPCTSQQVQHALGFPSSAIACTYLARLVKSNQVHREQRDQRYWYGPRPKTHHLHPLHSQRILKAITDNGPQTFAQLLEETQIPRSSLARCLSRLIAKKS